MKLHSVIPSRMALTVLSGIAFAASIAPFHAKADAWDKKTVLTVNQTIQVRDTVLEPGQYVLRLYDSQAERHVVQIFNADQSHLINTVLAIPRQRMEPTGETQFTFWETPAGKARAMRTWFYPGDLTGQEFPYPKHLIELASAAPAPTVMMTQPAEPVPAPEVETTPEPEAQAQIRTETREEDQPQPVENQPVEIAQAAPPPAPVSEPSPPPANELPKTGSPYPMMGISGGILLLIYGLVRLKRLA